MDLLSDGAIVLVPGVDQANRPARPAAIPYPKPGLQALRLAAANRMVLQKSGLNDFAQVISAKLTT